MNNPEIEAIIGTVIDIANVIGLLLAVIAFIVAREQSRDLTKISDAMSTRYLGYFPDYLRSVVELLDSAQQKIEILVGNPCPAYFTDQAIWLAYKQVLERKAIENVRIRMVHTSAFQRESRLRLQFTINERHWPKWKKDNGNRLDDFLANAHLSNSIQIESPDQLIAALLQAQNQVIEHVFNLKNIELWTTDELVSVQVWIIDESQAIFSMQTATGSDSPTMSHGLYTADVQFVKALRSLFRVYGGNHW